MESLQRQLDELTNAVLDDRAATSRLATDLRESIYQVAEPLNAAMGTKAGLKEVEEVLSAQDEQLQELHQNAKQNEGVVQELMDMVEDTMPTEDTKRHLRELDRKIGELDRKMGEQVNNQIAAELSNSEGRLLQQLDQRIETLTGRIMQVEQAQMDVTQLASTLSSRVKSGLSEADREIKSVAEELSRSVAKTDDVHQASLNEADKMNKMIAALDSKLDDATTQLATLIEERANSLDGETADLAAQMDATLEKVHDRMDALSAELQQSTSHQNGQWKSTAETIAAIHTAIESLQEEADTLASNCTKADATSAQTKKELTELHDRQLDMLEKHVEKIQTDSEHANSKLSAALERVQRQGIDSAERIDAVNSTLGSLGADMSACGKDIAKSIDDSLLCRKELQQATERLDAKLTALGDTLHSLDTNLSSRISRSEARAEAISKDLEQADTQNEEISTGLQDAFDGYVSAADQRATDVAACLNKIENESAKWVSMLEVLQKKQRDDTSDLARRADEIDARVQSSADALRAELQRHILRSLSEQGGQLRDTMADIQESLERQMAETDASSRSNVQRLTAEYTSRIDTVADSLEEQISRSRTDAKTAMSKLESDIGMMVDRTMGTLEQNQLERSRVHDSKMSKSTSELSTLIQTIRDKLEATVNERCSGQDVQIKKIELDVHERLEMQQLEISRVQGEFTQSVTDASDSAKRELTNYIDAQERATKDTSIATSNAIEDASSTLEARILDRIRTNESRLAEAISGMSDDVQKTRVDFDGTLRERVAALDSALRGVETAIRVEMDNVRSELRGQLDELGNEHNTKLSRSEDEISDRMGTVGDEFKNQLESLNAGLKRQLQEGIADAKAACNKVRSDLVLELDNKCSTLQREREHGDAQVSATLATQFEAAHALLSQSIEATHKSLEEKCTSIHEFADHIATETKQELEATIAQNVGQLTRQSAQLEADVGKLVEDTCAALDEHWSSRISEQMQRIADFESAIVQTSDTAAAGLKQHVNQVTAEQNSQLRHLVSQASDFDLKIDDLKTSVEEEWTAMEEKRQAAVAKSNEMESLLAQLQSELQTTVMETLGGLSSQVTDNKTEHNARVDELARLVTKVTEEHANTARHGEDTQSKLAQMYTDMAELVQAAQLTIEEQINASVATHDQRMSKTEEVVESVIVRVSQCEAAGANFDNSLGQLSDAVGNVRTACTEQAAQRTSELEQQLNDLKALANANLANVTNQGQQIQEIYADMSANMDRYNETLTSSVAASQNSLSELQSSFTQLEALVNRNTAAVEDLRSSLGSIADELMGTIDSTAKHLQDATSNVSVDVADRHASVLKQLTVVNSSVEEAITRVENAEKLVSVSTEQAAETSVAIEALHTALGDAADLSKAQLDATAQASETRVLGVESRLENLATVLGQEVEGVIGTIRDEVEGMLDPYDGRITELEAATNTGLVRMGNTEARLDKMSSDNAQTHSELKAQLDDVDKILEAERGSVSAQLREVQRKADVSAADLRSLVEDRAQAAVAMEKEALARLQAEMTEIRTRTVPELGRQQASTDAKLKKLQSEALRGSLTEQDKTARDTAPVPAATSPEEARGRLEHLEERTETLKGTVGKALEMLGRLRNEHGARINRLEEAVTGGASSDLTVQEGVPGIPTEQLKRIAEEFEKRSGSNDQLTYNQAEQSIRTLGFACGASYFGEVWRKYDQGGRGSLDFPTFCAMWLFIAEGLDR